MRTKFKEYRSLWPEAVRYTVYISNRTFTKRTHESLRNMTSFEIITGEKSDLTNFRIFGTLFRVVIPKISNGKKFDRKLWDGYHVGYASGDAYRIKLKK